MLSARSAADAGWLYGAHVARYVAPLLLYPVLTRRLGLDGFGVYAAGLALALIVAVVVDYGLSLAGPRDIAADVAGRGVVVGQALALRALLIAPAVAAGFGLAMATPALQGDTVATAMAVVLGAGQGASLLWYFQGVRDPAPAALLEVGFMSNLQEEQILNDPAFQEKIAQAIVDGLEQFFLQAAKMRGEQ